MKVRCNMTFPTEIPTTEPTKTLSTENPDVRKTVKVGDAEMAYVDYGEGDPIIFMHGNPTSSFLWRNVAPHAVGLGRIIIPDMIAHGHSSNSPRDAYRYADNVEYFDAFFDQLNLTKNVVFVLHDWGAAIGFYRSARFPEQVQGIAYMESMVRPRFWTDMPPERQKVFRNFRTPEGEKSAVETNFFVEKMLFEFGIKRDLSETEKNVYRRRTTEPGGTRLPSITMPNDIPFDGDPADNYEMIKLYGDWLRETETPKLFVNATEGHGTAGAARDLTRTFKNQTEVTVDAKHYVQEDQPAEVGQAVAAFVKGLRG